MLPDSTKGFGRNAEVGSDDALFNAFVHAGKFIQEDSIALFGIKKEEFTFSLFLYHKAFLYQGQ